MYFTDLVQLRLDYSITKRNQFKVIWNIFNFAVPAIIMRDAFIDLGRRLQNNSQRVM